ncbi:MFS transporter [Xaviernesmea oryzae]|nr:MFS transporter [Xaviernesmea oryzae]
MSDSLIDGKRTRSIWMVFAAAAMPMALAAIDMTAASAALPTIGQEFQSPEYAPFVVISYLVAATISAPAYGRLADMHGRRNVLLSALGVFIIGSFLCGFSTNLYELVACRFLQGMGGGGLMALAHALIGEVLSPRQRGYYQGYLSGIVVAANAIGPVIGGLFSGLWGWRSIFTVSAIIGVAALCIVLLIPRRPPAAAREPFDFFGLLLFSLTVATSFWLVDMIKNVTSSSYASCMAVAALTAFLVVLLTHHERRVKAPLFPVPLLMKPVVWRSNAMGSCHGAALVSLTAFYPLYLQENFAVTPLESGMLLLPLTAGIGIGALVTGNLVSRSGKTAIYPAIALAMASCILLLMSMMQSVVSPNVLSTLLAVVACLMGSVMGVVQILVQHAAGKAHLGVASASVSLFRNIGASLGTALIGTLIVLIAGLWQMPAASVAPNAVASHVGGEIFALVAVFTSTGSLLAASLMKRVPKQI